LRGFSLVELLVVIGLIAILTAIAVPSYLKYRDKALLSKVQQGVVSCLSDLTASYADSGLKTFNCTVPDASGNCTLQIVELNGQTKVSPDYCDFVVEGRQVRCFFNTNFGDVNGFVYCKFQ